MMLRPTLLVAALAASSFAWGQALDPPERIARLSYVEGQVAFQPVHDAPSTTLPDRPLAAGDRLLTDRGGRAELALGTAAIRLDESSELAIVALDPANVRVELAAGTVNVHLRELYEDETFEIATPSTSIALDAPGEYRVEVPPDGATALTVRGGLANVATAGGAVRVGDGQRVELDGRDALARLAAPAPADAFDDWVLNREVQLADAEPPRYTPYEGEEYVDGEEYEELDSYGEWYDEPRYGRVWMPAYAYGGWSPFSHGRWVRVGYGWSWFDPLPWSAFTFHSGRWAFLHHLNRWCWVPGPRFHGRHFRHGRDFDHRHRFADDTRPFGHPRRRDRSQDDRDDPPRDARSREDGEAVLRRALWRSNPKTDERRPVAATTRSEPRRIDADRPTVFRPDVESEKRSQAESVRRLDDRSRTPTWRPSSASRGSSTTARPSGGSTRSTMAPSRPSSSSRAASRSSQRSESSSSSSRSSKTTFAVRPQ